MPVGQQEEETQELQELHFSRSISPSPLPQARFWRIFLSYYYCKSWRFIRMAGKELILGPPWRNYWYCLLLLLFYVCSGHKKVLVRNQIFFPLPLLTEGVSILAVLGLGISGRVWGSHLMQKLWLEATQLSQRTGKPALLLVLLLPSCCSCGILW